MILELLQLLLGLALLYFGGEWLVKGASLLALRLGVSPLVIGVTIVAAGTSAPELMVSITAALEDQNDISLGNVVGSNICNVALILGVTALLHSVVSSPPLRHVHTPFMVIVTLALVVLLLDGQLGRVDGLLLLAGIVGYTWYSFHRPEGEVADDLPGEEVVRARSLGYALVLTGAGLGLLLLGAKVLVAAAVSLATEAGVSKAFIGLTIVALGTSLPELTTSVIAAIRREGDIAVGNIVGSNLFNILGILGLTALIEPLSMGGVTWFDLGTMLALAILLAALLLYRRVLALREGGLLLAVYIGYITWLAAAS